MIYVQLSKKLGSKKLCSKDVKAERSAQWHDMLPAMMSVRIIV